MAESRTPCVTHRPDRRQHRKPTSLLLPDPVGLADQRTANADLVPAVPHLRFLRAMRCLARGHATRRDPGESDELRNDGHEQRHRRDEHGEEHE